MAFQAQAAVGFHYLRSSSCWLLRSPLQHTIQGLAMEKIDLQSNMTIRERYFVLRQIGFSCASCYKRRTS